MMFTWLHWGVFKAADIPPHRDHRNQPNTLNYVTEIGVKDAGGLWVANAIYQHPDRARTSNDSGR